MSADDPFAGLPRVGKVVVLHTLIDGCRRRRRVLDHGEWPSLWLPPGQTVRGCRLDLGNGFPSRVFTKEECVRGPRGGWVINCT
jgi:hypothetical protein